MNPLNRYLQLLLLKDDGDSKWHFDDQCLSVKNVGGAGDRLSLTFVKSMFFQSFGGTYRKFGTVGFCKIRSFSQIWENIFFYFYSVCFMKIFCLKGS